MKIFDDWIERMGLKQKEACEAVGLTYNSIYKRRQKDDVLTKTELLAMSAVRAGLQPWSDEEDVRLLRLRRVSEAMDASSAPELPPA